MSLVAYIGGTEPAAATWGDLLSTSPKRRTERTPGRKPVIGAAVTQALEHGPLTSKQVVALTGLPPSKVYAALWSMRKYGFVQASGKGPGATWRLS